MKKKLRTCHSAGLISASFLLPWRQNPSAGESPTPAPKAASPLERASGSASIGAKKTGEAAAAGASAGSRHGRAWTQGSEAPQQQSRRVNDRVGSSGRSNAAGVASAPPPKRSSFAVAKRSLSSSSSASASASADRLPDPSRHNEGAPAWMRSDLSVDRVRID